ncbi:uncharacterized protein cubi_01585 [Cryptosporidium ubiquitum]|uniref:Uncharacterized protein n=1 Tax=Cryptosporidium ubiquitum TaxID=857276 RepID=A0A1J4MGV5_9CRYT|nr:uncharacterized protein cubi_01585 [Cryptosporidium ubiquitum]OII72252.1 hypothetical protein cubi_01585 [Cryptosporidium ubiquitum]
MAKCRGFKPGGVENPYYYKRKLVKPDGSTIKERLQRSTRPTWEELRKMTNKTSEGFCNIDDNIVKNDEYRKKLDRTREEKLSSMLNNISNNKSKCYNNNNDNNNTNNNNDNSEKYYRVCVEKKRSHSFDRSSPNNDNL